MVIQRYLVKEVLQTMIAVLALLLLVFLGRHFARYLAEAAAGELPAELIFKLLTTLTLSYLHLLLPFSFYLAVLLAFGRLYRDNEMTALSASGVGTLGVLTPIVGLGLAVAGLVGGLALAVSPWAAERSVQLREQAEARSDLQNIVAGQFREMGTQGSVFYVEQMSDDKQLMKRVFVQNTNTQEMDIFAAQSAYQHIDEKSGDRFLVLLDGRRYEGIPGSAEFRVHEYAKNSIRVDQKEIQQRSRKRDAQPTGHLIGSDDPLDRAELQWRLSMPLSALLLAILAVLLSRTSPREGRYARLFGAILVFIVYLNLMGVGRMWMERGAPISQLLGLWWVHVLLSGLIAVFLIKHYGFRYLFARVQGR